MTFDTAGAPPRAVLAGGISPVLWGVWHLSGGRERCAAVCARARVLRLYGEDVPIDATQRAAAEWTP